MFGRIFNQSTQISKTDWEIIYEVEHGGHRHFEVFKKRLNRRFGTVSYPTDKAFGIWAWTCMTLERAKKKLEDLNFSVNRSNDPRCEKCIEILIN